MASIVTRPGHWQAHLFIYLRHFRPLVRHTTFWMRCTWIYLFICQLAGFSIRPPPTVRPARPFIYLFIWRTRSCSAHNLRHAPSTTIYLFIWRVVGRGPRAARRPDGRHAHLFIYLTDGCPRGACSRAPALPSRRFIYLFDEWLAAGCWRPAARIADTLIYLFIWQSRRPVPPITPVQLALGQFIYLFDDW